jgi:RecB family endonuclease NucS
MSDFLSNFIVQSLEGNLKTSQYEKDYLDLKMKVSFGMGMPARIPWISFTAPGMSTSNGYYPVFLYYKEQNKLILAYGISETSESSTNWPSDIQDTKKKIIEEIIDAPRYGDSYIFEIYNPQVKEGKVSFFQNSSKISIEKILIDLKNIIDFYKKTLEIEVKTEGTLTHSGLFYMEQQLEDFIIENWTETVLGQKYDLITEDGILKSQQYQTNIGRIDILATDKTDKSYVVIELKRNQTSDDTVGQVLRYMGWVKENLKDNNVKGIIVAGKYDEKLHFASTMVENVDVFIYEVNFSLNEHKRTN